MADVPDEAPTAAVAMRMTAAEQQFLGVVDIVVPELAGGAHTDVAEIARRLHAVIVAQLDALTLVPIDGLEARYRRYRDLGPYTVVEAPTVAPPVSRGLADRLRDLIGSAGGLCRSRRVRGRATSRPPTRRSSECPSRVRSTMPLMVGMPPTTWRSSAWRPSCCRR